MEATKYGLYEEALKKSPSHITKVKWTNEEDKLLSSIVDKYGPQKWDFIARFVPGRNGKQCRERWLSTLAPNLCHSEWNFNEDIILLELQKKIGNHWSAISKYLPGRTAIMTKNRFKLLSRREMPISYYNQFQEGYTTKQLSSPQSDPCTPNCEIQNDDQIFNIFENFDDTF